MTLRLGPVLYFRGARERAWQLSALVGVRAPDEPPALETDADRAAPSRLAERCGLALWRYDFALPLEAGARAWPYRIGERAWPVHLPGARGPLRLAYTACNGSEQGDAWDHAQERNDRWLHLAGRHAARPFHLLLQGGDQLYADPIWQEVPALAEWKRMWWWRALKAPFPPAAAEAVRDAYFRHYWRQWAQAEIAPVLASVPSLMMWDDHDIFDGWGSWQARWQRCPTFQGIWRAAREHFALFQLGARPDDLPDGFGDRQGGHFGFACRIGDVGIIIPDLRSERTRQRVMGEAGRRAFIAALDGMGACRHVLLLSSMPLVNPDLTLLERLFTLMPGHQTWQDDLVDQWPSRAHWREWQRLLEELAAFSARTGARLTSLSGEIHMGALGVIESGAGRIHQLTSSGIAHPPPPEPFVRALEWVARRPTRVTPEITARLVPLPGLGRRFLRARNWLELELGEEGGLSATWHGEGPGATSRLEIAASDAARTATLTGAEACSRNGL